MTFDDDGVISYAPFLRSAFNYDRNAASVDTGLLCDDGTRTQQQFAEECDINTIVERFGLTGELPQSASIPFNADFDESVDFRTCLDLMREAERTFMLYPAEIRARFQNDPTRFVDFVSDPLNVSQVKEWGLGRAESPLPAPIEVRVIPTPPDPAPTP
ncbi:internal scaffolding protein [robinz microvirus RP_94]|nr:internal scaffolding protein [robinz microvirus RP_94]